MRPLKIYLSLSLLLLGFISGTAQTIGLSIPDLSGVRGDFISVPVNVDSSLTGQGITSYQVQITFTSAYLSFTDVQVSGTLTENLGSSTYHQNADNQITVAAADNTPLEGTGVLVYLRFQMIGSGYAYLNFEAIEDNFFNEGDPVMIFDNGRIQISNPPVITVSPNGNILTKGDELQFSVSGGTAPYTWSVTDPAVASINASGLLTANAHGFTRVVATDQVGIIDTCDGDIEIRAFQLSAPDTAVYQGHTFDLPVYSTTLTGLDISSGSFSLTYAQTHYLEPISILTTGTLLDGYSTPQFHASDGQVNIGFAGDAALDGEGVLLYVRFLVSLENHGGSNLNFQNILFNESYPATNDNGYCNVLELVGLGVSPSTGSLLVGEPLQFGASGGEVPYSWSVSDPGLATIDASGLLTALAGGTVTVTVQDAIGATGSSGLLEIYDAQITIPDTVASAGSSIDLPLLLSELPVGHEVFSFQATVTVDPNVIQNMQVINLSTLSDGWSVAENVEGNSFVFALAGTVPITTGGTLINLRFEIDPDASNGHQSTISFTDIVLNEGSPRVLSADGVLNSVITGMYEMQEPGIPDRAELEQNYPNPFNPQTQIRYEIPAHCFVNVTVYDGIGNQVAVLVNQFQATGNYQIIWNGEGKASGLYFLRLSAGSFKAVRKMLLMK